MAEKPSSEQPRPKPKPKPKPKARAPPAERSRVEPSSSTLPTPIVIPAPGTPSPSLCTTTISKDVKTLKQAGLPAPGTLKSGTIVKAGPGTPVHTAAHRRKDRPYLTASPRRVKDLSRTVVPKPNVERVGIPTPITSGFGTQNADNAGPGVLRGHSLGGNVPKGAVLKGSAPRKSGPRENTPPPGPAVLEPPPQPSAQLGSTLHAHWPRAATTPVLGTPTTSPGKEVNMTQQPSNANIKPLTSSLSVGQEPRSMIEQGTKPRAPPAQREVNRQPQEQQSASKAGQQRGQQKAKQQGPKQKPAARAQQLQKSMPHHGQVVKNAHTGDNDGEGKQKKTRPRRPTQDCIVLGVGEAGETDY